MSVINNRVSTRADFVTSATLNDPYTFRAYTDRDYYINTHNIDNPYTDSIISAYSNYATRSSVNFICDYPVYDGYLLFPQGVRIELLNKPSDDFLKEIALLHKAEWKDRT